MNFKIFNQQSKEAVKDYIDRLPVGRFDVSVKKETKIRTISSNRLYWLWLNCISHETGNDRNELHEFFGLKYLSKIEYRIFGEVIIRPASTTLLTTVQFSEYLNRIEIFASSELGIVLPHPEDRYFQEFYEKFKDYV